MTSVPRKATSSAEWMYFHDEKIPHDCEHKNVKDDLYFMYSGRSCWSYLARGVRGFFLCSHTNLRAIRFFRSHASIEFERSRQLRLFSNMIHPFSYFRVVWELIMLVIFFYSILVAQWSTAFPFPEDYVNVILSLRVMRRTSDVFCCLNVVMNFMTGRIVESTRRVELSCKGVAKLYLTGFFIIDLIGAVPLTHVIKLVYLAHDKKSRFGVKAFSFLTIGARALGTVPYLSNTSRLFRITHETRVNILVFFGLLCYFHYTACFFYFVALAFDDGLFGSWLIVSGIKKAEDDSGSDMWPVAAYGVSLSRSIATSLGHCSRFAPITTEDQLTSMIYVWVGAIFYLVVVGKHFQVTKAKTSSRTSYNAMITQVEQYMASRKLPSRLRNRVIEFYEFRFHGAYFNEKLIKQGVSRQLRQDYAFYQCRSLVQRVGFFNNLPTQVLMRIVAVMQTQFFLRGDTVIEQNTVGSAMFFVKTGTVAVYSGKGSEVCHLEDGSHFGEISLVLAHFRRVARVVTIENCELYRLERDDFNAVMSPYPEYLARVRRIAMQRLEKTIQLDATTSKNLEEHVKALSRVVESDIPRVKSDIPRVESDTSNKNGSLE